MAELVVNTDKIISNIKSINSFLSEKNVQWSLIPKVLCGNEDVLSVILDKKVVKDIHSIGDSRISNLRAVKNVNKDLVTMYIKPPAIPLVPEIVEVADISLNTSIDTIKAIEDECIKQDKFHKVIIMIEMGELREGVMRDKVVEFYEYIFNLTRVEVIGIGTNLGCMYGIEPTYDKLIQLSLYKELIEAKFKKKMEVVSGGSSINLPMLNSGRIPKNINHLRIGEAVFFGTSPLDEKQFMDLHTDVFVYKGNIIEMEEKETIPDGVMTTGNIGHTGDMEAVGSADEIVKTHKAIVDFGILDVDFNDIAAKDDKLKFVGTTSDMTVYEIPKFKNKPTYNVGDTIDFSATYMGVAKLMNSKFIEKIIV